MAPTHIEARGRHGCGRPRMAPARRDGARGTDALSSSGSGAQMAELSVDGRSGLHADPSPLPVCRLRRAHLIAPRIARTAYGRYRTLKRALGKPRSRKSPHFSRGAGAHRSAGGRGARGEKNRCGRIRAPCVAPLSSARRSARSQRAVAGRIRAPGAAAARRMRRCARRAQRARAGAGAPAGARHGGTGRRAIRSTLP